MAENRRAKSRNRTEVEKQRSRVPGDFSKIVARDALKSIKSKVTRERHRFRHLVLNAVLESSKEQALAQEATCSMVISLLDQELRKLEKIE